MARTVKSFKIKNLSPSKAKKFLLDHGFKLSNIDGDHFTYYKKVGSQEFMPQIIDNNKQLYWKNVETMIRKSSVPKSEWIKELFPKDYRQLKK